MTAVLVVEFTVWSVDTVLWLVVQVAQYLSVPPFSAHSHQGLVLSTTDPYTNATSAEYGWLHCGGPGAGHFVKMVHNGVEYGIMQAYAEGFNILHHGDLGSKYVKEGDAEVAPMENPADYQYDIDVVEVLLSYGVVVVWLAVGYLILPLMYYDMIMTLANSMEEYQTLVRVVGLSTLLWILVYPHLSYLLPYLRDSTQGDLESLETRS